MIEKHAEKQNGGKNKQTIERNRKLIFSTSEITKITELVEENLEVIQSKLTNFITNRTKQETNCPAS